MEIISNNMEIVLAWLIFSFLAGYIGVSRKIGFWSAFFISIFLSPLIGFIITFASDKKASIKQVSPAMMKLIIEGDKLIKQGKVDEAIGKFNTALSYSNKAPYSHFQLAKLYSLKQDSKNSFNHFVKSIQDGFKDFERINQGYGLSYLRNTTDFKTFVANGYKMATSPSESTRPMSRVEELEKLNSLLEKGVLTKDEFENEKKKILS